VRGCVGAWVRGCVRAWVRGCVRVCVRACARACARARVCVCGHGRFLINATQIASNLHRNGIKNLCYRQWGEYVYLFGFVSVYLLIVIEKYVIDPKNVLKC